MASFWPGLPQPPPPPVTVNENGVVCVAEVPVPVTVTEYAPAGVVPLVVIVIVDEPPEVTDAGLNEALAPLGKPLAERLTVWALPDVVAVLTVAVTEPPAAVDPEPGETEIEKSLAGGVPLTTKSSLFGEPVPGLVMTPLVALLTSESRTCCGVNDGFCASTSAAAPVTCGVAIDVPLMVFVAVLLVFHAEVIEEPGAKMSRQVPMLENEDRASVLVVDPTVIAVGVRAGEVLHAFAPLSLPAATA